MQRFKLVIYKVNVVNQPMIFNERFSAFSLHLVTLNLSGNDCAHHMLMISIIPHVKILDRLVKDHSAIVMLYSLL